MKPKKQQKKRKQRKSRKTHVDTLIEIIQEHRGGKENRPTHKVLRDLIRDRRAENLLLVELRRTIRKWRKGPSKLPRNAVARKWAKLLKM